MMNMDSSGSLQKSVLAEIEKSKDKIVRLTCDLIRFKTVNPPGENYVECANFIAKTLKENGFDTELVSVPSEMLKELGLDLPRVSVLGKWHENNRRTPTLHINGHYDVVPEGTGWNVDPFAGVVKDGRILGRGASDMKCGIAMAISAATILKRLGVKLKGNLTLSSVPDEETGGETGTGYLIKSGFVKADMAIVNETGGIDKYTIGYRGGIRLSIKTLGKTAHGSRPFQGINAVEKMAKIIVALTELRRKYETIKTKAPIIPPQAQHPTIMVGGTIRGGVKENVVPDECTISVDRRLIPEENSEDAIHEIEEVISKLKREDPELKAEVTIKSVAEAASSPEDTLIAKTLVRNIHRIVGVEPTIRYAPSGSDFRFFSRNLGIPTVNYGPGIGGHVSDEYVPIADLVTATKVLALTIMESLGFE